MKRIIILCLLLAFMDWGMDRAFQNSPADTMKKNVCYCEYCGHRFPKTTTEVINNKLTLSFYI